MSRCRWVGSKIELSGAGKSCSRGSIAQRSGSGNPSAQSFGTHLRISSPLVNPRRSLAQWQSGSSNIQTYVRYLCLPPSRAPWECLWHLGVSELRSLPEGLTPILHVAFMASTGIALSSTQESLRRCLISKTRTNLIFRFISRDRSTPRTFFFRLSTGRTSDRPTARNRSLRGRRDKY